MAYLGGNKRKIYNQVRMPESSMGEVEDYLANACDMVMSFTCHWEMAWTSYLTQGVILG